jgi:hypothetical protein
MSEGRSVVGRVVSPLLVGRAAEMARLVDTVRRAPAVVVVSGEAGIGKSRLVAEMAAELEPHGVRVRTGVCQWIREPFPLGPIVEALRDVGTALTGAELSRVAGVLRPLLPELEDFLPSRPPPLDDRAAERHRIFRGLVEVLGALGPTVLVVEDAHWADEQTLEFLGYLLAAPPPSLSLVVTFRGEDAGPGLRLVTARPAADVTQERLELAPLNVEQTRDMAQAILGAERITDELAAYLCARGSGIPLAVQELLALLRERGTLAWRHGRWARRTVAELDVPVRVRDSVLERVARLTPGAGVVAALEPVSRRWISTSCRPTAVLDRHRSYWLCLRCDHVPHAAHQDFLAHSVRLRRSWQSACCLPNSLDTHGRTPGFRQGRRGSLSQSVYGSDRTRTWTVATSHLPAPAAALRLLGRSRQTFPRHPTRPE